MSEYFVHLLLVGFCCFVCECYGIIFESMAGYFKDRNSKPPIPTVNGKLHTIVCSLSCGDIIPSTLSFCSPPNCQKVIDSEIVSFGLEKDQKESIWVQKVSLIEAVDAA